MARRPGSASHAIELILKRNIAAVRDRTRSSARIALVAAGETLEETMNQTFTRIFNETTLLLEHTESDWTFYNGINTIAGIQEDIFTAHCERMKRSLSKDMPLPWTQWLEKPLPERIFDVVSCWRWNGIFFLEDCTEFPFCEGEIPAPQLLPDGSVSLVPVHEYLKRWKTEAEKRHYPLSENQAMDLYRNKKILAKYWGFREIDGYYKDDPYDFLTESIQKPLGNNEYSCSCDIRVGQAPNGRWGVTSRLNFTMSSGVIWSKYQFPSRESAILHEIELLKKQIPENKDLRSRKDILEWLEQLKSSLIQPELFSFAG